MYSTCLKQKLNQNGIYFNDTSEDGLNLKCNEERLEFILMKTGKFFKKTDTETFKYIFNV